MQPEAAVGAPKLRLVLAPDAQVVVEGTAAMLSRAAPEIDVIRLLDTRENPGPFDVLLYDPQKHMLADFEQVLRALPQALVVAFSFSTRADIVAEARRDGAAAFLSKELSADELVTAVRALRAGHQHRFVVTPFNPMTASPASRRPQGLTERELDVLELITHGHSNDEIARRLFLSINSVKSYIRTGYRKIGATRRAQAVLWGVEQGLGPTSGTQP